MNVPSEVICPRCKREAHGWPVLRADVCSPKNCKHCIRQPENVVKK